MDGDINKIQVRQSASVRYWNDVCEQICEIKIFCDESKTSNDQLACMYQEIKGTVPCQEEPIRREHGQVYWLW